MSDLDAIIDGLLQAGLKREKIILVEAVGASFPGTGQADRTIVVFRPTFPEPIQPFSTTATFRMPCTVAR
jgi:hypothetical protein